MKWRSPLVQHDDVIKWKHFPRNWPFVREIHRSPVNFPHKGQRRGALMFSLIYAWINDWVNNREAGDLRRQHGHYDVIVMGMRLFCPRLSNWRVRTIYCVPDRGWWDLCVPSLHESMPWCDSVSKTREVIKPRKGNNIRFERNIVVDISGTFITFIVTVSITTNVL